jgi:hypothetical protein
LFGYRDPLPCSDTDIPISQSSATLKKAKSFYFWQTFSKRSNDNHGRQINGRGRGHRVTRYENEKLAKVSSEIGQNLPLQNLKMAHCIFAINLIFLKCFTAFFMIKLIII